MSQIPITTELDFLFQAQEFALDISDGVNPPFKGIVTDFYDELLGGSVGMEGAEVLLIAKTTDVSTFTHGTILTVGAENFTVVNTRQDNYGITRIQLARS